MEILEIDGAFGESGGQIVRTALTLSCITKKPIVIQNIRKNRKVSGLRPQHLTALNILKKISNARVEGGKIGSTEIKFIPNELQGLELKENVGTAGSICLILQTIIPTVAICRKKLKISIIGGTDVFWSPTSNYTIHVLKEAYSRMGIDFSLNIEKRGYYPKGGGKINLEVFPTKKVLPIILTDKKKLSTKMICSYSKLGESSIKEKISVIQKKLEENLKCNVEILRSDAIDSGATLLICSKDENSIVGVDCLYDKKIQQFDEHIVEKFLESGNVDECLSDMLVVPASLAEGMTVLRLNSITKHLETNLFVASKITGCKYGIGKINDGFELRIQGISYSGIH